MSQWKRKVSHLHEPAEQQTEILAVDQDCREMDPVDRELRRLFKELARDAAEGQISSRGKER